MADDEEAEPPFNNPMSNWLVSEGYCTKNTSRIKITPKGSRALP